MKKLMMFAAVVAMTFGVMANTGYNWSLSISTIDGYLPQDFVISLWNQNDDMIAVVSSSMFNDRVLDVTKANATASTLNSGVTFASGSYYYVESGGKNTAKVSFGLLSTEEKDLRTLYNPYFAGEKAGTLRTVLAGTVGGEWKYQTVAVTWNSDVDNYSFSSNAAYNPIPEPTSGLLMLLGMAGLFLKRKNA